MCIQKLVPYVSSTVPNRQLQLPSNHALNLLVELTQLLTQGRTAPLDTFLKDNQTRPERQTRHFTPKVKQAFSHSPVHIEEVQGEVDVDPRAQATVLAVLGHLQPLALRPRVAATIQMVHFFTKFLGGLGKRTCDCFN